MSYVNHRFMLPSHQKVCKIIETFMFFSFIFNVIFWSNFFVYKQRKSFINIFIYIFNFLKKTKFKQK